MSVIMSLMMLFSTIKPTEAHSGFIQKGKASFYASKFNGRKTSSGERVDSKVYAAAHRTLPFNTMVEITNLANNRSVIVRINDRGPFSKGRIVDMTHAAAKALGFIQRGVTNVKLRVVGTNGVVALGPVSAEPTAQLLSTTEPVNRF
ncbi:septal ring lytic transglycosylase RlpA family protein [Rudanella lutea]|uniref:septal ring lytic transglycosylase RlpA family protein n=1 Tax=Rudanella lutea TaxID=451374 RepID=UPI0004877BA3|nr:septal ring lytic transglycosylase RlpA family protein [Rudanella lutea]